MISVDSEEINKLQHYYDYMYAYITIITTVFYLVLLSFGFVTKFVIIEINKRILKIKRDKMESFDNLKN